MADFTPHARVNLRNGLLCLMFVMATSACGITTRECGPSTCDGCCDEGECIRPTSSRCGIDGAACATCEGGESCVLGACQMRPMKCDGARVECNGACVDLLTNGNFCGRCDNACSGGKVCRSGTCT